jgi:hypothetical protein
MMMTALAIEFFVGSDMLLRATVTDKDGKPKTNATVECTIVHAFGASADTALDCSGMSVPIVWPIIMDDVGGGKYEYIFDDDLPIVKGVRYKSQTTVTLGGSKRYTEPYIKAIVDRD